MTTLEKELKEKENQITPESTKTSNCLGLDKETLQTLIDFVKEYDLITEFENGKPITVSNPIAKARGL